MVFVISDSYLVTTTIIDLIFFFDLILDGITSLSIYILILSHKICLEPLQIYIYKTIWHYLPELNMHLCYMFICYTLAQLFQSWMYKL